MLRTENIANIRTFQVGTLILVFQKQLVDFAHQTDLGRTPTLRRPLAKLWDQRARPPTPARLAGSSFRRGRSRNPQHDCAEREATSQSLRSPFNCTVARVNPSPGSAISSIQRRPSGAEP